MRFIMWVGAVVSIEWDHFAEPYCPVAWINHYGPQNSGSTTRWVCLANVTINLPLLQLFDYERHQCLT